MRTQLATRPRALLALVALLFIGSLLPLRAASAVSRWPFGLIHGLLLVPVTHPLHRLGVAVRGGAAPEPAQHDFEQLRQEHDRLWQYSRRLEDDLRRLREENAQLRQVRQADRELATKDLITASVTSEESRAAPYTLTINRGERDGVRKGATVASGLDLVGVVADAGYATSTVRLATTPGSGFGVRIVPPKAGPADRETVTWADAQRNGAEFWAVVGKDQKVEVGDLAHVAGDASQAESRGYVLGVVADRGPAPDDPTMRVRVVIKPRRDLRYLERVVVVVPRSERGD